MNYAIKINSDIIEQAEEWYNSTPKSEILAFCKEQGFNLYDDNQLKSDWNSDAITCRASFLTRIAI